MAREYTFTLVMHPDFSHENEKKREETIRNLVGNDVTIKDVKVLGKKALAYPIRKFTEGVYLRITFESPPIHVSDIQKRAKLNEEVLRYLLTQQGGQREKIDVEKIESRNGK